MEIKNPLTNSNNIKLERIIKTNFLIDEWKKSNIDVARFFNGQNKIYLYQCLDSGYKFYYPFNLEGDDKFYQDLQNFSWYYFDWKWEYDQAFALIKPGEKILEIGCGKGDFLAKLKQTGFAAQGMEFNEEAIKKCRAKGLEILRDSIEQHAQNHPAEYDIVCSFQVMEHITQIGEAIKASLKVLKTGGKLIISVPNDDSFMGNFKDDLFNMPPHHQGLWNENSLKNLEKIFNIKLKKIYLEPLQAYHYRLYYSVIFAEKIKKIFGPLAKPINKIFGRIFLYLATHTKLPQKIKGHTIMAVYIKT